MSTWQVQEAKNRLSEVIREARDNGPQVITRHGAEEAVLLSYADYRRLTARRQSLVDFFLESPLAGSELDLTRDPSGIRPGPEL